MDLFRTGDTEDIYQFDAPDIRNTPSKRNTPLLQEFLRRKKSGEVIHYPIPEMAEVLDETYGLLLYPELLMLLAHKLGNLSLSDAYTLSISMGRIRRDRDWVMNHYLPMFIKGGCEKGYPKDLLEQIFTTWWQYGGFAKVFPKCSNMGLVLNSYQMAYLKAHYSKEWIEQQILRNIFQLTYSARFEMPHPKQFAFL